MDGPTVELDSVFIKKEREEIKLGADMLGDMKGVEGELGSVGDHISLYTCMKVSRKKLIL